MSEAQRKYTILPGVPTPDYETILSASSDYSEPGELDYKTERNFTHEIENAEKMKALAAANPKDVEELIKLGEDLSNQEEAERIASQNRMNAIKERAVQAAASMDELREAASKQEVDDERREQLDAEMRERDEAAAKQEELERVRAERRAQQKKAVEELKAKAAANEAAAEAEKAKFDNDDDMLNLSEEDVEDTFGEFLE